MSSLNPTALDSLKNGYTQRAAIKPKLGKRMMKYVDAAVCYGAGRSGQIVPVERAAGPPPR